MVIVRFLTLSVLLFLLGCSHEEKPKLFELIPSTQSGIVFSNELNYSDEQNIIEYLYFYNGGGVATGDINNDGLVDIFFTANQKSNSLYLNKGNMQFEDISISANISQEISWSTGVSMADVNGDGFLDIYVCNVSNYKSFKGANKLYINNGDLSFTESASAYGVDFSGFSTHVSFLDFDHDGDLDMYLLNHSVHTPRSYRKASTRREKDELSGDRLFENLLNEGELNFRDVTEEAKIYSSAQGFGLGLVTSDVNQDGWVDIYVGNDFHENDYLYINQKDGTFKESLDEFIGHTSRFTMGVDIADLNGDNLFDIISTDMLPRDREILLKSGGEDQNQVVDIKRDFGYGHQYARNALQINKGNGYFSELASLYELYATDWSWSVLVGDYDNDGHSDIYIANGILKRPNDLDYIQYLSNVSFEGLDEKGESEKKMELLNRMPELKISNMAFSALGNRFQEVTDSWGLSEPSLSNGAVYSDLDNDGDLDIVVNNVNQKAFLFQNNLSNSNFLELELTDDGFNTYGIGAHIYLYSGEESWIKEVTLSRGFQSSIDSRVHFGLGKYKEIDSLVIVWPDGTSQVEKPTRINQLLKIEKKQFSKRFRRLEFKTDSSFVFQWKHTEDIFHDYTREHLIPRRLSREGPAMAVGDVDGDGFDDVFFGGAHGQSGVLFLAKEDAFHQITSDAFEKDALFEDVSAQFYDLDSDGDLDLYVVSGGNKFLESDSLLSDRIYLNNGRGIFYKKEVSLPKTNGSVVRITDFNKDGNADIFVGSLSIPGSYGMTPSSFLLTYQDEKIIQDQVWNLGMVTSAEWYDWDSDTDLDLLIAGEWMPLTILENKPQGLVNDSVKSFLGQSGWWSGVILGDMNNDGRQDVLVGNLGLNTKLATQFNNPASLYLDDFDGNGQSDPILFYKQGTSEIPLNTRLDLIRQMPFLKKNFVTNSEFSEVKSFTDLIPKAASNQLKASSFATSFFLNKETGFELIELPIEVQWSRVKCGVSVDFDEDGDLDLILAGNDFSLLSQIGRQDASTGLVLKNDGKGKFKFHKWLPIPEGLVVNNMKVLADKIVLSTNNSNPLALTLESLR